MKIFFITSKLNFRTAGGSIEEFDVMIRNLIKLGNEVTAVTAFSYANDIPEPLPYKVIEENITARGLLGIQKGIFKIFRKYSGQADVFHVDGHNFLYGAGLYRKLGGKVPVAAFFNRELSGWPENESALFSGSQKGNFLVRGKKFLRWHIEKRFGMPFANGMDIFSFTNPVLQKEYEKFGLRHDPGALIIGDPLDYKKIFLENNIAPEDYSKRNKKSGKINLFYSSRMAAGKGFDLLLKAFSKVKNKEKFRLILGGTGPEEGLVRQMAKDLKLDPYVEFTGWVSRKKLYQLHKEADIFTQARWRRDNTSISLSYAMAFGLPSILPGGGGLEWVAKNSALYFKDNDYEDLAAKIEQLGGDYKLREELSKNCRLRLEEEEMDAEKNIYKLNQRMLSASASYRRTAWDKFISRRNDIYYSVTEPVKLRIARARFGNIYKKAGGEPLVSVIMPTFKRGRLLIERTLPSILSQTCQNFEVIIVGDNRLDNTEELIKKLDDPRIKFCHWPEYEKYPSHPKMRWFAGGSVPRNRGLELARGEWIAELDDDDIFVPDHIESLLRFAQKGNYEFVSACYERERYGKREVVDAKEFSPRIGGIGTWFYRSYLRFFKYNVNCWRKSYNCPQEIDRQFRMSYAGVRIGFLDKVVTVVLPLPGSETTGLDALEIKTGKKLR